LKKKFKRQPKNFDHPIWQLKAFSY
jgi:hypothetical protein